MKFGVVTTAGREEYLARTLDSLHRGGVIPEVFKDLAPGLTENHRAAAARMMVSEFKETLSLPERFVMLQDDLLVCKRFGELVDLFARRFPHAPMVSFFSLKNKVVEQHRGEGFYWTDKPLSDLAVMYTSDFYRRLDWFLFSSPYDPDMKHHDVMVAKFLRSDSRQALQASPCPVQHVGYKSTLGTSWKVFRNTRDSSNFPGEDWDGYEHFSNLWGMK